MRKLLALPVAALLLAGCLAGNDGDGGDEGEDGPSAFYDPMDGLYHHRVEANGGHLNVDWAPGALSMAWTDAEDVTMELPPYTLLLDGARWTEGGGFHPLPPGQAMTFLPPPTATAIQYEVREGGSNFMLVLSPEADGIATESWNQIVSGESMVALEEHQEANFPHRTPGMPNYAKSVDYFAQYFRDLGYEVEVDPYGLRDATGTAGCVPAAGLCPESMANIVAMKPGVEDPDKVIFVAGGHYDMVPATTHAAFDDTSGTVGTMELARALAPYDFRHTIAFGLWGGEEDGLLGSQFWVQSHPEMRARILSYWNLDVIGMSWPAPRLEPDPIVISAGPDAPASAEGGQTQDPVSGSLLDWARTLQQEWLGFPDEVNGTPMFHYEGHAAGQAGGYAQVNAQSDHTPFAAAGIPSYFIFNGDTLQGNPVGIHDEKDTLANMTKVAWYGAEAALDDPWPDPATLEPARQMLARSWEASIWFPFYHAILVDLGVYTPPAVAANAP